MSGYDETPRGIPTYGIGSTNNGHYLNRGITMAHVWGLMDRVRQMPVPSKPAKMGRPAGPAEITKFPYAGKDKFAHGEEWGK